MSALDFGKMSTEEISTIVTAYIQEAEQKVEELRQNIELAQAHNTLLEVVKAHLIDAGLRMDCTMICMTYVKGRHHFTLAVTDGEGHGWIYSN